MEEVPRVHTVSRFPWEMRSLPEQSSRISLHVGKSKSRQQATLSLVFSRECLRYYPPQFRTPPPSQCHISPPRGYYGLHPLALASPCLLLLKSHFISDMYVGMVSIKLLPNPQLHMRPPHRQRRSNKHRSQRRRTLRRPRPLRRHNIYP